MVHKMDNNSMPELEYRDFSEGFHERMADKNKPINGQFELTFGCGLRCVYCYSDCYNNPKDIKRELTFREVCNILDQIADLGCLWLCFTGGDPLTRPDFLDIYAYAKGKGFVITLFTNGTLFTPDLVDYFKEYPPFSIEITLNAVTQETYERISQVPGSFVRALRGIELILERRLPLKLKTHVLSLNYHELGKIKSYVQDLGMEFRIDPRIYPRLDGSPKPCKYRLSPEEIIDLLYQHEDSYPQGDSGERPVIPSDSLFRCSQGLYSFYISPYGELIFCNLLRSPSYDLKRGSFKEGFYRLYPEIRQAKYKSASPCRGCRIYHLCWQCPAKATLENEDPEKPIEYFCRLAHLEAKRIEARRYEKKVEVA